MLHVVADDKIPFLQGALPGQIQLTQLPAAEISREQLQTADALLVRTRNRCNAALLQGTPVKFIASATIGYDHIDTQWCDTHGIHWTNAPGCNADSVRQYVASALAYIQHQQGSRFEDLCLGIIGAGHVGSKVAGLGQSVGMKVLINDPPRQLAEGPEGFTSLNELIAQSDIISLHVPLNHEGPFATEHMVDATFLQQTKPGAWLINSSRGEVAQTEALIHALENRHLGGAILDVWENEPRLSIPLMNLCAISTPHIAGYSTDGKAMGTAMSVRALSRFFGLGLDHWYPAFIQAPDLPLIDLAGARELSVEGLFYRLSMHTYDIIADSQRLRQSPQTFETQRGQYPLRREPHAYKVIHAPQQYIPLIRQLGFKPEDHHLSP